MADVRDALRFAGLFNPLLAPIAAATDLSYNFIPAAKDEKQKPADRPVGTVTSILGGKPYKVYAGEDYGEQSLGTYLKLRQANPDKFPDIKGGAKPTPAPVAGGTTAPVTADWATGSEVPPAPATGGLPDATQGWGTPGDIATEQYPGQVQTSGKEPGFENLQNLLEKSLSPEFLKGRTDEAIRQFVATSTISQALGAEKSRERYKREVELERIKQWTDLQKATMQTNLLSQALLGQAFISAQQPNAAMADVLAKGTQAAQGAIGGSFQLKA